MCNETLEASTKHHRESDIDGKTITMILIFVVLIANFILTIRFYLSWRKRKITKHLSAEMDRKSCASFRYQTHPQMDMDENYEDIRESYFTNTHRETYKCIEPGLKGRNTYRQLRLKSTQRGRNRDGRNREKLQTLNPQCVRNSQDVGKLKSGDLVKE